MSPSQNQPNTGCAFCNAFHSLVNGMVAWFKTPFQSGGNAVNWVLFVGLLIIAAWFWQVILLDIKEEV
jgi:hypothetical protein